MKKVLVVLLVAVMAVTSAFAADVTGSVTAELAYNLDTGRFEYKATNGLQIKFEFKETLNANKSGSLKPYVDVAAEVDINFKKEFANVTVPSVDVPGYTLTKFQIVGDKWVLDFIPEFAATDFATDAIDGYYVVKEGLKAYKFNPLTYAWDVKFGNSLAFTYDGIGTLTLSAEKDPIKGSAFAVAFKSNAIDLTDELKVNAAVGYSNGWDALTPANTYKFGGSVKATYGELVTIASDMGFANEAGDKVKFDADIAAKISYKPVTFDVYYATEAKVFNYKGNAMIDKGDKDVVSMKAEAKIEAIDTVFTATASKIADKAKNNVSFEAVNTTLEGYEFTLKLNDLAHKKGIGIFFGVDADVTEDLNLTASFATKFAKGSDQTFKAGAEYVGIDKLTLAANAQVVTRKNTFFEAVEFNASAKYEAALFDVEFDVWYNKHVASTATTYDCKTDVAYESAPEFEPTITDGLVLGLDLSTDKIVDGATLDFNWKSGQLTDIAKASFGKLSASCKVEF